MVGFFSDFLKLSHDIRVDTFPSFVTDLSASPKVPPAVSVLSQRPHAKEELL